MLLLLCFLALIPSYGIGYLLNTLCRTWWVALAVYVVFLAGIVGKYYASIHWIYMLLLALIGVGALLSSLTVRSFKRGRYEKFL